MREDCEIVTGVGFAALAVFGFKRSLWLVVVALAAHGILDFIHRYRVSNRNAPGWWPDFCMAYDISAVALLGWRLRRDGPAKAINNQFL